VSFEFYLKCEEAEAKIADIEAIQVVVVNGIGTEVPSISGIATKLDSEHSFEFCDFLMSYEFGIVHAEMGVVVWVHLC